MPSLQCIKLRVLISGINYKISSLIKSNASHNSKLICIDTGNVTQNNFKKVKRNSNIIFTSGSSEQPFGHVRFRNVGKDIKSSTAAGM